MRALALASHTPPRSVLLGLSQNKCTPCTRRPLRLPVLGAGSGGGAEERRTAPAEAATPRRRATIALAATPAAPMEAREAWLEQYAAQQQVL